MGRDLVELIATGAVALTLLASSAVVWSVGGESDKPPAPAAPVASPSEAVGRGTEPGWTLFLSKGCNGCHPLAGAPNTHGYGPELTDLAHVAGTRRPGLSAEAYVRESILQPQEFITPGFGSHTFEQMPKLPITDEELEALVRFLLTPSDGR